MTLTERIAAQSCAVVALTNGGEALVDAADAEWLSQWTWTRNPAGYAVRYEWNGGIERRSVRMHRALMPGVVEIDHANGDKLDNRRANLRPATRQQQSANTSKRSDGITSRYKGVSRTQRHFRKPWEDEAGQAYAAAAADTFGEYARAATR